MPDDPKPGKTLWEMISGHGSQGTNGSHLPFYNPLDLRVGDPIQISNLNADDLSKAVVTVDLIRYYLRRIGQQTFEFTDYVLKALFANDPSRDSERFRIRSLPAEPGAHTDLLLRLDDEFAFSEDFQGVLQDAGGIFEIRDDDGNLEESFARLEGLRDPFDATVTVIKKTDEKGLGAPGEMSSETIRYWDYGRESASGDPQFLFVEMNQSTGWFQIWRGGRYYSGTS